METAPVVAGTPSWTAADFPVPPESLFAFSSEPAATWARIIFPRSLAERGRASRLCFHDHANLQWADGSEAAGIALLQGLHMRHEFS